MIIKAKWTLKKSRSQKQKTKKEKKNVELGVRNENIVIDIREKKTPVTIYDTEDYRFFEDKNTLVMNILEKMKKGIGEQK